MLQMITKTGLTALVLAVGVTVLSAPSFADVSNEARAACEKKADEAQLDSIEREAFVTNCLADATPDEDKE